jgi:hypothetical protein
MSDSGSNLSIVAGSCRRAAFDAADCTRESGCSQDCRDLCSDAEHMLTALANVLGRPARARRAPGLRRMIEAGLTVAIECAAECESWADEISPCSRCAGSCEDVATSLRALLTDFVDDRIDEKSGAT